MAICLFRTYYDFSRLKYRCVILNIHVHLTTGEFRKLWSVVVNRVQNDLIDINEYETINNFEFRLTCHISFWATVDQLGNSLVIDDRQKWWIPLRLVEHTPFARNIFAEHVIHNNRRQLNMAQHYQRAQCCCYTLCGTRAESTWAHTSVWKIAWHSQCSVWHTSLFGDQMALESR